MSLAQNTMNFAQILELKDEELVLMAEEHLSTTENNLVENILNNYETSLTEEDREELANFILQAQNQMPH